MPVLVVVVVVVVGVEEEEEGGSQLMPSASISSSVSSTTTTALSEVVGSASEVEAEVETGSPFVGISLCVTASGLVGINATAAELGVLRVCE